MESGDSKEPDNLKEDLESGDSEEPDGSGEGGSGEGQGNLESGDSKEPDNLKEDLESGDSEEPDGSGEGGSGEGQGNLESGDSKEPDDLKEDLESGDSEEPDGSGEGGSGEGQGNLESGDSKEPDDLKEDLESGDSEEPDGLESGSGDIEYSGSSSGEQSEIHPLAWVERLKVGNVSFASEFDIDNISEFVVSSKTSASLCSNSQEPMSTFDDTSTHTINQFKNKRLSPRRLLSYDCLKPIVKTYHYPEYAVGLLDNGCTAFLIGPYHAMTSARCVYDNKREIWEQNLDFSRGRKLIHIPPENGMGKSVSASYVFMTTVMSVISGP